MDLVDGPQVVMDSAAVLGSAHQEVMASAAVALASATVPQVKDRLAAVRIVAPRRDLHEALREHQRRDGEIGEF